VERHGQERREDVKCYVFHWDNLFMSVSCLGGFAG
jgi:hypothetical protein